MSMETPPPRSDQPKWRRIPAPGAPPPMADEPPVAAADEPESAEGETPPPPPVVTRASDARRTGVEYARVTPSRIQYTDPTFGYLIAFALNIGLIPIAPEQADLRYTLVWLVLGAFGVFAWVLGETERIARDRIDRLVWGIVFGLILGLPILFFGGTTLETTVRLLFRTGTDGAGSPLAALPGGAVLALLTFAMPTAETLFFRGLMQNNRPFWLIGILSSAFAIFLFFPMVEVGQYPLVAVLIGTVLTMMNLLYSYVRDRSGLAAAWLCQITVNVIVIFIPYMS